MDASTKLILDEMEKKFSALDAKWEQKFSDMANKRDDRLGALEQSTEELEAWRPKVDAALDDVKLELRKLNKKWDRSFVESPAGEPAIFLRPDPESSHHSGGRAVPMGFREDKQQREQGFGSVTTLIPGHNKVQVAQLPEALGGLQVPERLLQRRLDSDGQSQVLVKWSSMPISLATWEDAIALRQRFPYAPAWGQAVSLRGENVRKYVSKETEGGTGSIQEEVQAKRSTRMRVKNSRVSGPEWCV